MAVDPKLVKLKDVDMGVGAFVGALVFEATGKEKFCDVCGKERAMWRHQLKKGRKPVYVYLCFGCGDH